MDDDFKTKTTLAKFEEFFSIIYKDDVFEILKKYPDERSLTVNYEDLEKFDPDLVELLIWKPEEVIAAAQRAIKNINPSMEEVELNIRFKDIDNNISLLDTSSRHINNLISVEGVIKSVAKTHPKVKEAVFECASCMRLHKMAQTPGEHIQEPSICNECGGRAFRFLRDESSYVDFQKCVLTNFKKDLSERDVRVYLPVILGDDIVNKLLVNDNVRLTGILKVTNDSKGEFDKYLLVNHIEYLDDDLDIESVEDLVSRKSAEYTNWRNQVLRRDKVCQCCGLDKRLHAHHIFGYEQYPELAYDVGNGIVLCQFCHDKYHSVYGIREINAAKFAKFIKRFGNR